MSQYTISPDRIAAIKDTPAAQRHYLTDAEIEDYATADWPEGQEHQAWLDAASPEEIADWIAAGIDAAREVSQDD